MRRRFMLLCAQGKGGYASASAEAPASPMVLDERSRDASAPFSRSASASAPAPASPMLRTRPARLTRGRAGGGAGGHGGCLRWRGALRRTCCCKARA
jgi:hypothetical protein